MILKDLQAKLNPYEIIKISENNIQDVYELMKTNLYYYSKLHFHELCVEECLADITALPPNTTMEQKFYYGIYKHSQLIAIIDYIEKYPNEESVYIGLFMLNQKYHGKGIAKHIMNCFIDVVKGNSYKFLALGCYEVNEIGYQFWRKIGFHTIETKINNVEGHVLKLLKMQLPLTFK